MRSRRRRRSSGGSRPSRSSSSGRCSRRSGCGRGGGGGGGGGGAKGSDTGCSSIRSFFFFFCCFFFRISSRDNLQIASNIELIDRHSLFLLNGTVLGRNPSGKFTCCYSFHNFLFIFQYLFPPKIPFCPLGLKFTWIWILVDIKPAIASLTTRICIHIALPTSSQTFGVCPHRPVQFFRTCWASLVLKHYE